MIVFATGNAHKVAEVNQLLNGQFEVVSLKDIGCTEDVPETSPTIEGNALQKARYVFEKYGNDCFSEDTGLEIEALNGEPGVLSARYAGENKNADANMNLVLKKLKEKQIVEHDSKLSLLLFWEAKNIHLKALHQVLSGKNDLGKAVLDTIQFLNLKVIQSLLPK